MRKIIREGVKTRVLMLSATPVNNRMADLRNQIVFATEGDDAALLDHGIGSIDSTTRLAQKQFNRWLDLDDVERTPSALSRDAGLRLLSLCSICSPSPVRASTSRSTTASLKPAASLNG